MPIIISTLISVLCCKYCMHATPTPQDAYRISWVGLAVELGSAVWGLVLFQNHGVSMSLAFGLECLLDVLSTAVVLWRFWAPNSAVVAAAAAAEETTNQNTGSSNHESSRLLHQLERREQRADVLISCLLSLMGLVIIIAALLHLAKEGLGSDSNNEHEKWTQVLIFSAVSGLAFLVLSTMKLHTARKLQSPALQKDGLNSCIGAILAFTLFINSVILSEHSKNNNHTNELWWLDPVVSLIAGVIALLLGVYALCMAVTRDHLPICSCRWWFSSSAASGGSGAPAPVHPHHRPSPQHFATATTTHRTSSQSSAPLEAVDLTGEDSRGAGSGSGDLV